MRKVGWRVRLVCAEKKGGLRMTGYDSEWRARVERVYEELRDDVKHADAEGMDGLQLLCDLVQELWPDWIIVRKERLKP